MKVLNPKLSIIISVYGQTNKLRRCLSCVKLTLNNLINYEILLIDDASEDETTNYIKSLESTHRVYFNKQRKGFAKNNNFLAREAKGEYLCLLNSDAFVQGNWLFPMLNVFETAGDVGFVGNVQKLADSVFYDHMGIVFGPRGNPRHFGQGFIFKSFSGQTRQWSAVTAACALVKKEIFLSFNGFDEAFVNGCEDVELCIRMSRSGYRHLVAHDSEIQHVKGASVGRKKHNLRNFEILISKCGQSIRSNESVKDQKLYAKTYIYQALIRPHKANLLKFLESILIFAGIKKISLKNNRIKPSVANPHSN